MKNDDISSIKGNCGIYCNDDNIVIIGKKLWIFRKDFTSVACRADICNAYKVAFLSENRLLVGQGKNASYRLLSLENGEEIWKLPPIKTEYSMDQFAISPDNMYAYDCVSWKGKEYLVTISLQEGKGETVYLQQGLRATTDIICDEEGSVCILQSHHEEVGGIRISQNGIRLQRMDDLVVGSAYYWKYKWQHSVAKTAGYFLDSTEYILTNDLHIFEPKTGKMYYLLEKELDWQPPTFKPCGCWLNQDKQLITLMYNNCNVIIDCCERRVVGRYNGRFTKGCLVNDEYVIASDDGIRRLAFPAIEDIPPQKPVFWSPN